MRRRPVLIFLACFLVAAISWLLFHNREPSYNGRSLSTWLRTLPPSVNSPNQNSADPLQAADAIRHIGTNAFPFLLKWIRHEKPAWRQPVDVVLWKFQLHRIFRFLERNQIRANAAEQGLELFGPQAHALVPQLTRMMNDQTARSTSDRAVRILTSIGQPAFAPLTEAMANPKNRNRLLIANGFEEMQRSGVNVLPAAPVLLECVGSFRAGSNFMDAASGSFSVLMTLAHDEPIGFLFITTNSIYHSNSLMRLGALEALRGMGDYAKSAWPCIVTALDHPDPATRLAATNAILAIAPEMINQTQ